MFQLSESNVTDYLRHAGRITPDQPLIRSLSGGVANVVLQVFDPGGGERVGSDPRSATQIQNGLPDARAHRGACFVLKQPLPKFNTQAEWLVDTDRVNIERDCMILLHDLLPAGAVPEVLWFDADNNILAISCALPDAVIWKKELLAGRTSPDAAIHAGMLLAIMHSSTTNEPPIRKRFGEPRLFIQQRIDPYLRTVAGKYPALAPRIDPLVDLLLTPLCLIHGDFSPKNIFLVSDSPPPPAAPELSRLLLLDFEVAFFGHPAFDVATLINHFILKGFYHGSRWRPLMVLADTFWQTYRTTAAPELVAVVSRGAGNLLGALLIARVDGKSPVEYLNTTTIPRVRAAGMDILSHPAPNLEIALERTAAFLDQQS